MSKKKIEIIPILNNEELKSVLEVLVLHDNRYSGFSKLLLTISIGSIVFILPFIDIIEFSHFVYTPVFALGCVLLFSSCTSGILVQHRLMVRAHRALGEVGAVLLLSSDPTQDLDVNFEVLKRQLPIYQPEPDEKRFYKWQINTFVLSYLIFSLFIILKLIYL